MAAASSLQARPAPPWRRAALALAGSLLIHALLLEPGGGSGARVAAPLRSLQAELQTPEPAAAELRPVPAPQPRTPPRVREPAPAPAVSPADPVAAAVPEAAGGPADPQVYLARELDRLPRPLQSLPRAPAGRSQWWLTIDVHGQVVDLAPVNGDPSSQPQLRQQLADLRFAPALREERAVKARILLELGQ